MHVILHILAEKVYYINAVINMTTKANTRAITPNEYYPTLAKEIGVQSLYFKREDLHPLGSHKGRSIPHMIDIHLANNINHFVISSSGNAALAAALYITELNKSRADNPIMLEIFAGKHINPHKLTRLQDLRSDSILVSIHERPRQMLFIKTKDPSIRSLRQSTDDTALVGYGTLAQELAMIPDLEAVFIGTSSGTTAEALASYFIQHAKEGATKDTKDSTKNSQQIEVHIVQTPSCHPLADAVTEALGDIPEEIDTVEVSLADAIVDNTAERRTSLTPLIEASGGNSWIVNNESIRIAKELTLKYANLPISNNSALSVAGVMSAVYTGKTWKGSVVCIICGE